MRGKLWIGVLLFLLFGSVGLDALTPEELRNALISRYGRPAATEFVEVAGGPSATHLLMEDFHGKKQSLSLLLLNTKDLRWRLRVSGFARKPLATVAEQCRRHNALIGVNGGYFFISEDGAPLGTLRIDGVHLERSKMPNGALFLVDAEGRFGGIVPPGKDDPKRYANAIQCAPALMFGGKILPQHDPSRHPRTAVGIHPDGTLIFLVADGRHLNRAAGLTYAEMGELFAELGCRDAMNLDGGGSSTLYFKGCNPQDIFNYPCDNKKFDHQGLRRVASALLIEAAR
ncbi:MAG: phosphodiester glycosidase family protein [Victivallaceae bacterium]|nr:phosphodiester glycosidase family protein [Victivallaceae bacterium]